MGRPREFNETEALGKAMEAFWAHGYEATSLCQLTEAMGISKSSFYETFGSKHELFLSAVDYYVETAAERMVRMIEAEGPVKDVIGSVFQRAIEGSGGTQGRRGCFLVNAAAEVCPQCPDTRDRVAAGFKKVEDAYYRALRRGQRRGEIAADKDARALARYLVGTMNGLVVTAKANPDRAALADIAAVALGALEA